MVVSLPSFVIQKGAEIIALFAGLAWECSTMFTKADIYMAYNTFKNKHFPVFVAGLLARILGGK
ncbi:hypothetical protein [Vitreoscilla stercoraria]|uniref:Uncharacterized protein n=1 Tax=Vitreoscilla stercoraria TaxID=61 RepID=A0ABY4E729_VITST|nr:hypothetical protein [Vitreoscilla stercoraria]UOO91583.1 hypothetical protein LVJ81_07975 [Vitreoscilla stercoraria]